MKPQPMSDAEIEAIWCDGNGGTIRAADLEGVRAIIAARDAQWAAMIGEPVAGRCRFASESEWTACSIEHVRMVQRAENEWLDYEVAPLYAIKETP